MKHVSSKACAWFLAAYIFTLALSAAISCYLADFEVRVIIKRDIALVGSVLSGQELQEWSIFTAPTDAQITAGAQALDKMSYNLESPTLFHEHFQPNFSKYFCATFAIATLAFALFFSCYAVFTAKINNSIQSMTNEIRALEVPKTHYDDQTLNSLRLAVHEQLLSQNSRDELAISEKKYMKDLLADMSHQLKTPLACIRMYVELISSTPEIDDQTRKLFLGEATAQLDRTEWLVQGLLKMARLEAGAVKMSMHKTPVSSTISQAVAPFALIARETGTSLTYSSCDDLFMHDADWLSEAIGNLIKNALEHASGRHVEVIAQSTPLTIEISVKDDGDGIEFEQLPHLFERFYKNESSIKPGSVGLGLALAREIITANGGTISVNSRLGKGTEFTIVFLTNN